VKIGVQFDQQGLRHFARDEFHFSLRRDGLIIRVENHLDVVIRRAERKPVRALRECGRRRDQCE